MRRASPRIPIDQEELPLKRSLISQILSRCWLRTKLSAIAPLAGREGCVNTIATLIGEIERAAKSRRRRFLISSPLALMIGATTGVGVNNPEASPSRSISIEKSR